jgi:hypothetical protein
MNTLGMPKRFFTPIRLDPLSARFLMQVEEATSEGGWAFI